MISSSLQELVEQIVIVARENKLDFVFMGGLAVSAWAIPRATYDIDLLLGLDIKDMEKFLRVMADNGLKPDSGRKIRSIKGLSFITLKKKTESRLEMYADVFLAQSEFARSALSRKKIVKIWNLDIPLISPEDLILYKLIARRERDLDDISDIIELRKGQLDVGYIREWVDKLGVTAFWEDELRSSGR